MLRTARATSKNPADPFIDRDGYLRYIDSGEKGLREVIGERLEGGEEALMLPIGR